MRVAGTSGLPSEELKAALYRLPELAATLDGKNRKPTRVYWCEGERDADSVAAAGKAGTTVLQSGARYVELAAQRFAGFRGTVMVIADRDPAGYAQALSKRKALEAVGVRVKVVQPRMPAHNDLTDHLDARLTLAQLVAGIDLEEKAARHEPGTPGNGSEWPANDAAPQQEPEGGTQPARERFRIVTATDLAEPVPPMRWLVQGVWPERSYGVLGGEKKTLKSYSALGLSLAIASGEPFLDTFQVPAVGKVLYLLGEGGQGPTQARLQRVAKGMGLDLRDVGDRLAMTYDVAAVDSREFLDGVRRALDLVQPDLVVLDPLYAFHPSGVEAQNLYERGRMLAELADVLGRESALIVADHFRKTGNADLDLDSVAQSGMAAWADSWVLQKHRELAAVDQGEFRLAVEFGSRQWGGARYAVDWSLGRFDAETGEHVGSLQWRVEPLDWAAGTGRGGDSLEMRITDYLRKHPREVTRSELAKNVTGKSSALSEALEGMVCAQQVVVETVTRPGRDGKSYQRDVLTLAGKLRLHPHDSKAAPRLESESEARK